MKQESSDYFIYKHVTYVESVRLTHVYDDKVDNRCVS